MERWLIIVIGTFFGCVGTVLFFLIYDRVMVFVRKHRHAKQIERSTRSVFPMKHVVGSERNNRVEELENLLFEEFDSNQHEILAVCLENADRAVAICLFLNDKEIEYYSEHFPPCCRSHDSQEESVFRNVMAAVSHWGAKWTYAEVRV